MALIPLNTFKTKTTIVTSSTTYTDFGTIVQPAKPAAQTTSTVYTAPIGVTSIILMAQVSNISTVTQYVNVIHHRTKKVMQDAQGNGEQQPNVDSYLVKNFAIPAGDAASVLSGKLIIESLDTIRAYSSSSGTLQLVLSILETANS